MRLKNVVITVPILVLASTTAGAQVVADLVAAPEIPAGNIFAPHTPSGMVILGSNLWAGTRHRVCDITSRSIRITPIRSTPGN